MPLSQNELKKINTRTQRIQVKSNKIVIIFASIVIVAGGLGLYMLADHYGLMNPTKTDKKTTPVVKQKTQEKHKY